MFSHINNLKENVGNIEIDFFMNKFETMNNSIKTLKEYINTIKKELDIYDITRLKHKLVKTDRELKNIENLY